MLRPHVPSSRFPAKLHSKALIKVGYACNSDCVFCHVDHYRGAKKSEKMIVVKKMAQIAKKGFDMVCLSGGEVTIRPEMMFWAKAAKKAGLLLGLVTNGRLNASKHYTQELYDLGLRYAYVSFYGATKEVHNYIAGGMDCWQEQIDGVYNLGEYEDIDLTLNVVMVKQNLPELKQIIDLFSDIHHLRIKFSVVEPKGAAADNFEEITPSVVEACETAKEVIVYGEKNYGHQGNLSFGIDGAPPCLIGDDFHHRYNDNLMTHGIYYMTETWEQRFFHVDDVNKQHMPECSSCGIQHRCPGIACDYENTSQGVGLRPLGERVAPTAVLEDSPVFVVDNDEPCPLADGTITKDEPSSFIYIRKGRDVFRAALSNESTIGDIDWYRRNLGQVQLGETEQQLTLDHRCLTCEHSLSCNLMFALDSPTQRSPAAPELPSIDNKSIVIGLQTSASDFCYLTAEDFVEDFDALQQSDTLFTQLLVKNQWASLRKHLDIMSQLRSVLSPNATIYITDRVGSLRIFSTSLNMSTSPLPNIVPSHVALIDLETAGYCINYHQPVSHRTGPHWVLRAEPLPYRLSRPLQTPDTQLVVGA